MYSVHYCCSVVDMSLRHSCVQKGERGCENIEKEDSVNKIIIIDFVLSRDSLVKAIDME